jgi:5-methylcytosine-specific restriction enzyme subunit McrC
MPTLTNLGKGITVYEHETYRFNPRDKEHQLLLEALERYHGDGTPFFKLIRNGVQFNEHVGVIQVGHTLIEVLPKADKTSSAENWRGVLIDMMRAVYGFDIKTTGYGNLKLRQNALLHLYFELFIKELEYLLHSGLVKKYRKKAGNVTALKGRLLFGKHLQHNLIHQEHFFVEHSIYDTEHLLHQVLYKALCLLQHINTQPDLHSRIGALLLNFPNMPDLRVTAATFEKLTLNRKTQHYQQAVDIAQLLLLNYHPDISQGRNYVLALMFNMNRLWEQFVYVSLRKHKLPGVTIHSQHSKRFWQPDKGRSSVQPDIWIKHTNKNIVLDTKWKNISDSNPSSEDLRQMYAYSQYFEAYKVALIYPGKNDTRKGIFLSPEKNRDVDDDTNASSSTRQQCNVIFLEVNFNITTWQKNIGKKIDTWINESPDNKEV